MGSRILIWHFPAICVFLLACISALLSTDTSAAGAGEIGYHLVSETPLPLEGGVIPAGLPFRPYLDPDGTLQLSGPTRTGPGACPPLEKPVIGRPILRLASPRVEELRCQRGRARLFGYDEAGGLAWTRELGFSSGRYRIEERLIGASPAGLVLNTLEVLSPTDGHTLVPARTRPVDRGRRRVPEQNVQAPALWLRERGVILHFAAEAGLLKTRGGLWSFDPETGSRRLLDPVHKVFLGAFWRVEDLAPAADDSHLLLAEKLGLRGAGGVALVVLSWPDGKRLYEHRLGGDHYCLDPRLVLGAGGQISLIYRDETAGRYLEARFGRDP